MTAVPVVTVVVAVGATDMKPPSVLPLLAGIAASLVLSAPSIAGTVSAGRSVGVSRSVSYSPARPSYSGAAAKPSSTARATTVSAPTSTGTVRAATPVASAAPASPPARQESSSGSFWTPFVLGYMMAPKSSHAAPSAPRPETAPAASSPAPAQPAGTAAPDPKTRTGPFAIDVPEGELLDGDCKIRRAAQEFIKGAKIDHSVVFLATPESGRCGKLRERLAGQVSPAILVKSDTDHIVLSRMMKQ